MEKLISELYSSTNPENLAKIGQTDLEINGLTGVVKNKRIWEETEAEHITRRACF